MKLNTLCIIAVMFITYTGYSQTHVIKPDSLKITVGKSILNTTTFSQPYRLLRKDYHTISVHITVESGSSSMDEVDFNLFSLVDDDKKLRIRAVGMFNFKKEKRQYEKLSPINENYNDFPKFALKGYTDVEIPTYKVNMLGVKKKNTTASLKSLERMEVKSKKLSYFLDFPITKTFTYGKIYYKDRIVGFTAVKTN
ncbi:hypothetical protein MWU59_07905 [Flavobacteriaceae bacterium F08102]|nr:hypothetical protein [Flavobacteriaceae bacterium F08102]